MEVVNSFVYLETTVTDGVGSTEEIKSRAAIAKTAVSKLIKIWKSRDITKRTKLKIIHTLVFSIFLYASECRTIKKTGTDKINAFEMRCYRQMLRIPWTAKRTNVSIIKELGIQERLATTVRKRVLKFIDHTIRQHNIKTLTIQGKIEGMRGRGRLRTQYTDQVRKLMGRTFVECVRAAKDRKEWCEMVEDIL